MYRNRITEHIIIDSAELRRNPLNHRRHPDSQRHALRSLLGQVGIVDELLAYRDPEHGLTLVDGEARWSEGGSWPVAVLDLTPDEASTVLAMLDKIGADAEIDPEALMALLDSLPQEARQTAGQAWSDDELAAIIDGATTLPEPGAGGDEFDPTTADGPTRTALGELWAIGPHRLLVGDCTDAANVARLMGGDKIDLLLTDPPYGIKRDKGFGGFGGFGPPIARRQYDDDWDSDRPTKEALEALLSVAPVSIIWGGNFFADLLPLGRHWLVWDKHNTMPTFGDCELAWTNIDRASVKKYDVVYNGLIGKEKERHHPTQKPVKLFEMVLSDYSENDGAAADFYAGSGTLLIAAHRTSRRAYLMEIAPRYADVILRRAEAEGLTVKRADD